MTVDKPSTYPSKTPLVSLLLLSVLSCSTETENTNITSPISSASAIDITGSIFTERSALCSTYIENYQATAMDIQNSAVLSSAVSITDNGSTCTILSNNIPNHDVNDLRANFATNISANTRSFTVSKSPSLAASTTALAQNVWDAIMLNGVVLDLLSAGCYKPNEPAANANGDVAIGCNTNNDWLLDPLSSSNNFGTDIHNAHTQPDGSYHYHGNPNAMFDDNPGLMGSPVIGFAADGFPIYGSYFLDNTNTVRKAISGYRLKSGSRPGPNANDPGGSYDGRYIDDYEFANTGDLDECNGMSVNGQYGYYVTDDYPWVLACFKGNVDTSFSK